MGQINSTSSESANTENGRLGLIQQATEELSAASNNLTDRRDDQVRSVKARIEMLIEDCLNLEACSDSEQDPNQKESAEEKKIADTEKEKTNSENENLIKQYLDGSDNGSKKSENFRDNENGQKGSEGLEGDSDKKDKEDSVKCEDSKTQAQNVKKDPETNASSGKADHVKVSDIISEMVSTEINQTHLTQLQKRTITTFNTFIDKVLDTSLQAEMTQEDGKTSESGIVHIMTQSLLPINDQSDNDKKEQETRQKSETVETLNRSSAKSKVPTQITFKDHIEKLLEQTIQENEQEQLEKGKKELKRDKFDAQRLVNNIIVQGLKMADSSSTSQLKVEAQRHLPEGYSQKHFKPNEKGVKGHGVDIHRQKSPIPITNIKKDNIETKSGRQAQKEHDIRQKDMYMNWSRGDMKPDPREMFSSGSYPGRRHSVSDRSREAFAMGSGNRQLGSGPRGAENVSAFQHVHPAYASQEYYKLYAAMGNMNRGHSPDPRGYPARDGKQQYHPRDCMCALCVQNAHGIRAKIEQPVAEPIRDKRSPNVPPHLAGLPAQYRDPAMIRPPVGFVPYQPLPSPKESSRHLIPPGEIMSGRRPNMSEGSPSQFYPYKRNEENTHMDRSANKPGGIIARPPSRHKQREPEYVRTSSSHSGSSDSSEAPLDLSVKKPKMESTRHRSASFTSSAQKRITPVNSFIKHLENSVDKHWQEMCSPSSSPGNSLSPKSQHLYPDTRPTGHGSNHGPSPGTVSPPVSGGMLHNRHLPSPHFVGGITVGQPLVNLERNSQTTPESHFPQSSQYENQSQPQFQMAQTSVDSNRVADNISKHEPIQNIIGNHDPNDILYLICRLCTQTYGSPYAFRKHFRSNHGFEPRADHTIVQTISATKMALHLPQPADIQMAHARKSPHEKVQMSPQSVPVPSHRKREQNPASIKPPASPVDTKSQYGSESGDSDISRQESEKNETKCLECPECGKSFQLNDFGSYKRHCRQHGSLLTSGPYTCTDCHLHFSDQKALREHYLLHVKESRFDQKDDKKINDSNSGEKVESQENSFTCVKCSLQFDKVEAYTKHLAMHDSREETIGEMYNKVKHAKEITNAHMDISVNTSSSLSIVKQAAESMTSQMCPDSSWDNVVKGIATSNKPDDTTCESGDFKNSPKSDSNTVSATRSENRSENSPCQKSGDLGSDASDANTQDSMDLNIYKHKKFFHHRKRTNTNAHSEGSAAKQSKLGSDSNSAKVLSVNTDSCDSSGFSDTGSNTSSVTETTASVVSAVPEKKDEKTSKTEARHNLPFVWDRPTRSQKKL